MEVVEPNKIKQPKCFFYVTFSLKLSSFQRQKIQLLSRGSEFQVHTPHVLH